jgi:hypothetical protein
MNAALGKFLAKYGHLLEGATQPAVGAGLGALAGGMSAGEDDSTLGRALGGAAVGGAAGSAMNPLVRAELMKLLAKGKGAMDTAGAVGSGALSGLGKGLDSYADLLKR